MPADSEPSHDATTSDASPSEGAAASRAGRPAPEASLPHPTRCNIHWRTFRFLFRLVIAVWLRFRTRGLDRIPSEGGGLVVMNHQSFLDPLLVGAPLSRPISYLARENLFRVPFVGWVIRNTYVMPINRDAASTASIRQAVGRMAHGFLVGIFPEGTRTADGTVGEFKPGFVALIRRSGLPVYPVGIAGAGEVMPRGPLRFRRRQVCVVYGEPILPDELQAFAGRGREEELVALVRERVVHCAAEAEAWRKRIVDGGS